MCGREEIDQEFDAAGCYRCRVRAVVVVLALAAVAGPAAAQEPARDGAGHCGATLRLPGIDVSSYQGAIDWRRVRAAGVVFAFARVSDGVDVVDERFPENFAAMKRAGIRRGAYQHFRASADPEAQADLLVAAVRRAGRADLPLVADVETDDGMAPDQVRARLARWLRRVERRTRRRPIVYTSPAMSDTLGGQFGGYHLWLAHYEVECPSLAAGWQRWAFWQHSSSGRVPGVNGAVDLDVFAGTAAELRRLGVASRASAARALDGRARSAPLAAPAPSANVGP
jgi:lysozyme